MVWWLKMGHDEEAGYATAAVASIINSDGTLCFKSPNNPEAYVQHVRRTWPIPDGLIAVRNSNTIYRVALEYKRPHEGVHGILTAIGQSLSYIKMGFQGSVIVVPDSYSSLDDVGSFTKDVLEKTCTNTQIGVLTYKKPDLTDASPFKNVLSTHKKLELDDVYCSTKNMISQKSNNTQWAFVREGETTIDSILQMLKTYRQGRYITPKINKNLKRAVQNLKPGADPIKYLSSSPNDSDADNAWRNFWYKHVLDADMQKIWIKNNGIYKVGKCEIDLKLDDNRYRKFLGGRKDSTKNKLVAQLNNNKITEEDAWKTFAKTLNSRAHSFRETLDSGLDAFGFLEGSRVTSLGDHFIRVCERNDQINSETVKDILRFALLKRGKYSLLLHYIYRLSEEKFKDDPFAFSENNKFQQTRYLEWLSSSLNSMRVLKKASKRTGKSRLPLQAERTILKQLGLVTGEIRIGVGIVINWPKVHESLQFDEDLLDLT
ncbi:MAG: hypothetical protein MPK30_08180 [Gammaproteobacteria bacterium]|nr:hypothetical protein [Gammaproteobacteria bacterium]